MPFALITIGLILIVAGVKDRHAELATQLKKDFTGKNNFFYWLVGIGAVGSVGYVPALREVSRMFLALILIVMIIADRGFFVKLTTALENIPTPPAASKDAQGTSDVPEDWKPKEDGSSTNAERGAAAADSAQKKLQNGDAWGAAKDVGGFILRGPYDLFNNLFGSK